MCNHCGDLLVASLLCFELFCSVDNNNILIIISCAVDSYYQHCKNKQLI